MKKKKLSPNDFIRQMQTAHLYKVADQLETLDIIDKLVRLMGKDLPEANYITQKIQKNIYDKKEH
jgi:hypothetical protein